MMDHNDEPTAMAEIEAVFALTNRGAVLVLCDGFSGTIPRDGTVVGSSASTSFSGPEFIDFQKQSRVCVVVSAVGVAGRFSPGDVVRFYNR